MSSAPTPADRAPEGAAANREITLISHSMLFYWWPIWVVGYVMALITYFENNRLAVVPDGSKLTIQEKDEKGTATAYRLAVTAPTKSLEEAREASEKAGAEPAFKP